MRKLIVSMDMFGNKKGKEKQKKKKRYRKCYYEVFKPKLASKHMSCLLAYLLHLFFPTCKFVHMHVCFSIGIYKQ